METRKKLQWTTVVAFAVTAWTWAGAENASAAVTAADIEASGTEQKMYVNASQDKEMFFGTATRSRKSGKVVFKVSSWNLYETGSNKRTEIDLSKLSNVKDNYIAVKTDDMEVPVIIRIPANDKVSSVRYNGAVQELEIKTGASKTSLKAAENYEWRTVYSNWQTPDENQKLTDGKASGVFGEFQFQGGTLYIRTPGEGLSKITETADATLKDCYDAGNTDRALKVYDAPKLPGRETKLNIAKQANGPSVSVQYAAGTLTLPKLSEYRIVTVSGGSVTIPSGVIKNESVKRGVTVGGLLSDGSESGILEVRTEPNNSRKKCASKWTRIPLERPSVLETSGSDTLVSKPAAPADGVYKWGGGGIKNVTVLGDAGASGTKPVLVKADYQSTSKGYDIVITSTSSENYRVAVMDKEEKPGTSASAKTLKANSSLTLSGLKDGQVIYIRQDGNSRTKTWAGEYTKFGTVDLPKQENAN